MPAALPGDSQGAAYVRTSPGSDQAQQVAELRRLNPDAPLWRAAEQAIDAASLFNDERHSALRAVPATVAATKLTKSRNTGRAFCFVRFVCFVATQTARTEIAVASGAFCINLDQDSGRFENDSASRAADCISSLST